MPEHDASHQTLLRRALLHPPLPPAARRPPPPLAGNKQQQEDELCALRAIYGDDFVTEFDTASYSFAIPEAAAQPHLVLRVHLPPAYPSEAPVLELGDSSSSGCLPEDVLRSLVGELEAMFMPGVVCTPHNVMHGINRQLMCWLL